MACCRFDPREFRCRLQVVAILVLVMLAGCQASDLVPVSGKITLDGKPLGGVAVTFQPQRTEASKPVASTLGSTGVTDSEGKYTLRSMASDSVGAAVGEHKVYIGPTGRAANDVAPAAALELPSASRNGSLEFKVPAGGSSSANFDLKSADG
jgi:hypothetical protein